MSLSETGGSYGGGPYQGPTLSLDLTQIVQSWAANPGSNNDLVLDPDIDFSSYAYSKISSTCTTSFSRINLDSGTTDYLNKTLSAFISRSCRSFSTGTLL